MVEQIITLYDKLTNGRTDIHTYAHNMHLGLLIKQRALDYLNSLV